MRCRFSIAVIGYLNLLTLLASIPIIAGGLWLTKTTSTCQTFLQKPLLIIGFVVLIVSLMGFVGACFNLVWALRIYLLILVLLLVALLVLIAFGSAVTCRGGGVEVPGKVYREYTLDMYSGWMRKQVMDETTWLAIRDCLVESKACVKIATWTPMDYMQRDLTPVQSGCCKPPTSCSYQEGTVRQQDEDCYRWNNAESLLCYDCRSCRAAVLEGARREWHRLNVANIVVFAFLVLVCFIGYCALRNTRREVAERRRGLMSRLLSQWDYYWSRKRWYDRRTRLCW